MNIRVNTVERDGRPFTLPNDSSLITDLPNGKDQEAISILNRWFEPTKKTCQRHTSYGYKHWLEDELGVYVSNNQLKDAMQICGFETQNYGDLNWYFKVKPTQELKIWLEKRNQKW